MVCVEICFFRINVSLDSPREKKTITWFVTDWVQKYIGLINLKDDKANIGTDLGCFGRGNHAQHNHVFRFSVECPFVEKNSDIVFYLSVHRIMFFFTVFTQQFWVGVMKFTIFYLVYFPLDTTHQIKACFRKEVKTLKVNARSRCRTIDENQQQ